MRAQQQGILYDVNPLNNKSIPLGSLMLREPIASIGAVLIRAGVCECWC